MDDQNELKINDSKTERIIFRSLLKQNLSDLSISVRYSQVSPSSIVSDLIRCNVKSTTIRTRAYFDPCLVCVPSISKTCANSFFDRSYLYAAPTLWNAIDLDIRLLPFDAFKKKSRHISI